MAELAAKRRCRLVGENETGAAQFGRSGNKFRALLCGESGAGM